MKPPYHRAWIEALLLAGLLVLSGYGQVYKYAGAPGAVAYAAGTVAICVLACRHIIALTRLGRAWLPLMVAVVLFTAATFAILNPVAQSGLFGSGSDRADALNQALDALAAGRYPYYERTYLGHVLTPMPGQLLLSAPAWLLGAVAWQNMFWLALLFAFFWRSFTPATAVLLAAGVIACHPGVMQDVVTGGDYINNAIYVLLATAAVMATARGPTLPHLAALAFLGIAVCSRPIYVVAPVALAALFWRHLGTGAAFRALAVPGTVALALTLPFYFYDPAGFTPFYVMDFTNLSIPHATSMLGLLSLAVAALAARLPFDPFALYGWVAMALSMIFAPVMVAWMLTDEYPDMAHLAAPITIFGALWTAKRVERRNNLAPAAG